MSRITAKFNELKQGQRKALIPYITAGDPAPEITVPLMHAMVKAGADLIELGVPFSDPMADGSVIEAAHHRALLHHVSLHNVLSLVEDFRRTDNSTPIALMGYLNPFEAMGYDKFAHSAAQAGVDGVLVVDLPPEEASDWWTSLRAVNIDPIFLLAPTTSPERIQFICQKADGYLYYVSLKGVTGSKSLNIDSVKEQVAQIKQYTNLPVGVGFGIRDAETATEVAKIADAVIVGTALVSRMAACISTQENICREASFLLSEMRTAIDELK